MYNIGLQTLRAKIRGFHAAGSTISTRISRAHKERKSKLWELKRELGVHCRYHLIAYGILRGVPYHQIEKCAKTNQPNHQRLLNILNTHNTWMPGKLYKQYDLAQVGCLLAQSTAPTLTLEKRVGV